MRFGEISDSIVDIDNALRWGYNWDLGPFEAWDVLGVAHVVEKMDSEGIKPAPWVTEMLAAGHETFFIESADGGGHYDPASETYLEEPKPDTFLVLADTKRDEKKIVYGNKSASMVDIGDGIACIEFHSALQAEDGPDRRRDHGCHAQGRRHRRGLPRLVIDHQGETSRPAPTSDGPRGHPANQAHPSTRWSRSSRP